MTDRAELHFGPDSSVERLKVHDRSLTDHDFVQIAQMPRLRSFVYDDRRVSLEALAALSGSKTLEALDLSTCTFEPGAWQWIAQFRHLRELNISDTPVTDTDLVYVASLEQLEHLNLDNTEVTDAGISSIAGLPRLRRLTMSGTSVTNVALRLLAQVRFEILGVGDTAVDEDGLAALHAPETLLQLIVSGTRVTANLIPRLHGLPAMEQLYALETEVGAGFRVEPGWLEPLRYVWLDGARTGVGAELRKLVKLEVVDLRTSDLDAADLRALAQLPSLRRLRLSGSHLQRDAVPALQELRQLEMLDLSGTSLSDVQRTQIAAGLPNVRVTQRG